jgi:hypothetical protein
MRSTGLAAPDMIFAINASRRASISDSLEDAEYISFMSTT